MKTLAGWAVENFTPALPGPGAADSAAARAAAVAHETIAALEERVHAADAACTKAKRVAAKIIAHSQKQSAQLHEVQLAHAELASAAQAHAQAQQITANAKGNENEGKWAPPSTSAAAAIAVPNVQHHSEGTTPTSPAERKAFLSKFQVRVITTTVMTFRANPAHHLT